MLKRFIALVLLGAFAAVPAGFANAAIVGVNVVDAGLIRAQDVAGFLASLKAAGVTTIRVPAAPGTLSFVSAAFKQGIGTVLVMPFVDHADRKRPVAPAMGLAWRGTAYSAPDMAAFTAQTRAMLDQLNAARVRLTAIEAPRSSVAAL